MSQSSWRGGASVLHFVIANQYRINRKPHGVIAVAFDRNRKTQESRFKDTLRSMNTVQSVLLLIEIETVKQNNNKVKKKRYLVERKLVFPVLNLPRH